MAQQEPETGSDSLRDRWRYFPRLLRLLWDLGPGDLRLIIALSLAGGLLPILDMEDGR